MVSPAEPARPGIVPQTVATSPAAPPGPQPRDQVSHAEPLARGSRSREPLARGSRSRESRSREPLSRAQLPKPQLPRLQDDPVGDPPSPASAWNIANALTVFRLVLVPLFVWALFAGTGHDDGYRALACVVFAVAAITDRIDGDVARRRGLVTEFGKLADPIADKALVGAALISLSLLHDLPWWVTVVVLAREVGVTLLRFWVIRRGVIPASRGGKLKTLLQGIAIGLFVLIPLGDWLRPIAWVFMIVAVVVAVATGLDYVARALTLRRDTTRDATSAARAEQ